ncbi:zf-HC2 domain-containing protein [Nonomuraea sp. NEAU-A123]|uniref:zf-HC2 domain-containing protein n=1 Tax=Nonomuraea sp. NEAU-A123 TaxID=2839649 RepID=UPI0020323094|nr:zf-HC2 domain-containing protein [Nonomuraea sp. NEAU-A123]
MTCEEVRLSLGAHALGALEPEEAMEIDVHLATCEVCGGELLDMEGVASFLGKVSERDVELVASPPRQVLDRLLNARARRRRRGRALLAVAASVAVMAVGGTVWTASQQSNAHQTSAAAPAASAAPSAPQENSAFSAAQDSAPSDAQRKSAVRPTPRPSASPTAPGREFAGENEARRYYATVAAFPGDDVTKLAVRIKGVPIGTTCQLVVVGKRGELDPTESWTVERETYADKAVFPRQTRIPMNDIARFEIVDAGGKVLVKIPVPKRK